MLCNICPFNNKSNTLMSLLEAPSLIEAPPNGSASCHIKWRPHKIEAPGASNKNLVESINKCIVQARHMLLKTAMAATTTCLTGVGLHKIWCVSNTLYARPYDAQMTRNRSALDSVLAPDASNRDIAVSSPWPLCERRRDRLFITYMYIRI